MRLIIFSCILLISLKTEAQRKGSAEQLYYFLSKDSLVGVKNQSGKIIIEPKYDYWDQDLKKPIQDKLIYFDGPHSNTTEPHTWGVVFDRNGNFLFTPFAYDNGPDGFSEGLTRFVKNKKIGFANRRGDIVIEPKFDYAGAFNYGIAGFCNGCVWKNKGEHSFVYGGTSGYINKKGDTLSIQTKRNNQKDQIVDSSHFLPYQFSYSSFEQKIIDSFYKLPQISQACFVNFYSVLDSNELQLRFEIVERPSDYFPYYQITAFSYSNNEGYYGDPFEGLQFYVSKNGKAFFFADYYNKKEDLGKWLKNYIKEAKEYLKHHPDAKNKF